MSAHDGIDVRCLASWSNAAINDTQVSNNAVPPMLSGSAIQPVRHRTDRSCQPQRRRQSNQDAEAASHNGWPRIRPITSSPRAQRDSQTDQPFVHHRLRHDSVIPIQASASANRLTPVSSARACCQRTSNSPAPASCARDHRQSLSSVRPARTCGNTLPGAAHANSAPMRPGPFTFSRMAHRKSQESSPANPHSASASIPTINRPNNILLIGLTFAR